MIVLIDNYDSFTFNLYQYIGQIDENIRVIRNDEMTADDVMHLSPHGIIISPGPCTPDEAGMSMNIAMACHDRQTPLLGICLGHQAIGQAFGAKIIKTPPMHGKVSAINHDGNGVFNGCNTPLSVARYHSLMIQRDTLPDDFDITAETNNIIMGMAHKSVPIFGVQFHPESIATQDGFRMIDNFVSML